MIIRQGKKETEITMLEKVNLLRFSPFEEKRELLFIVTGTYIQIIEIQVKEIIFLESLFLTSEFTYSPLSLKLGTKIVDGGFLDPRTFIFNIKQGDVYAIKFD